MLRRALLAALVLAPAVAGAAGRPEIIRKGQKFRSLQSVIEEAAKSGARRQLVVPITRMLGFDADVLVSTAARYKRSSSPDGREHVIHLIGSQLVLAREGTFYRADAAGKLLAAASDEGPLDAADPKVRKGFEDELKFYLQKTTGKPFDP